MPALHRARKKFRELVRQGLSVDASFSDQEMLKLADEVFGHEVPLQQCWRAFLANEVFSANQSCEAKGRE